MSHGARVSRRVFLTGLAAPLVARTRPPKLLRGIFTIAATPFRENREMAVDDLAKQIGWLHRCGAQGIVWPQRASEYDLLSFEERLRGFDVIAKAAAGRNPALVFGVQGPDTKTALRYLEAAVRHSPDALIAMPPEQAATLDDYRSYYLALAAETDLPIFIQTAGGNPRLQIPVELIVELADARRNLGYVKEDLNPVLGRMIELNKSRPPMKRVFSGGAGKGLLLEMGLGMDGTMPGASYTDVYVDIWSAWHADRRKKARQLFDALLPLINLDGLVSQGHQYMLWRRGVFESPVSRRKRIRLTQRMKNEIERAFEALRPFLRA